MGVPNPTPKPSELGPPDPAVAATLQDPTSFAPWDPLDGRVVSEWRSQYSDPTARNGIRTESWYLGVILALIPLAMLAFWLEWPKAWIGISDAKYDPVMRYSLAWLGGTLGGTLFSIKWLYHSVARRVWHLDRRLWRLFTPHISGGLAFAVVALISSGLVRIFDEAAVHSSAMVVGTSFLVGYFSDSAIAKLSELADTLFGESRARIKRLRPGAAEIDPTRTAN